MSTAEIIDYSATMGLPDEKEVTERDDAANKVQLYLDPRDPQVLLVRVEPKSDEQLPFGIRVDREEALEAFEHPYSYTYIGATALLPNKKFSRWDKALDDLNDLPTEAARGAAMKKFDRLRKGTKAVPTLLNDAVRFQQASEM